MVTNGQEAHASGPADEPGVRPRRRSSQILMVAIAVTVVVAIVGALSVYPLLMSDPEDAAAPVGSAQEGAVVVAVARTAGGAGEWSNWARVFSYLSDQIGRPVTLRYLTSEEEIEDVLADEPIDLALVCPHQYVDLAEQGRAKGVVTPVISGSPLTSAMLVVAADSPVTTFEDLRGRRIAVSDKTSLGGYAYMMWLCERHGVDAAEYFAEVRLGDTLEHNARDVLAGEVDCTVVNASQLASDDSRLRVVERSPEYGTPPIVVVSDIDAATIDAIRDALVAFDPDIDLAGAKTTISGFVPTDPEAYEFVRDLRDACGHHDHAVGSR